MKTSERFTKLSAPSSAAAAAATPSAAARRRVEICRDARARPCTYTPARDHGLSCLQSLVYHDVVVHPLRGDDRPLLDSRIRLDDEHVLTVLSRLHGLRGNDRGVRQRRQPERHACELTGP